MNISLVVLFIVLVFLIVVIYYFIFDSKHGNDETRASLIELTSNRTNPIYLDQESFEQIKDKMTVMTVSPSSNSKFTTNIVYLNGTEFQYR